MANHSRISEKDLDSMGLVWDEVAKAYCKKTNKPTLKVSMPVRYTSPKPVTDLTKPAQRSQELLVTFDVNPMGKPRMTQSDKWKKREVTDRYWELKDHLVKQATGFNFKMPDSHIHVIFHMPMPDSWNKGRKIQFDGTPHQNKPDCDNLIKALQDSLCKDDKNIWDLRMTKRWAFHGKIEIYKINY